MKIDIHELKEIISLNSDFNKIQDLDILFERILSEARKIVHAEAGSIYLREGDRLIIKCAQNDTKQKPDHKLSYNLFTINIDKTTLSGYAAATGKSVNVKNVYKIPKDAPYGFNPIYDHFSQYKTKSNLTIPLKTNVGEVLGVIQIINAKNEKGQVVPFDKDDELIISHFATNATIALQRAQLTRALLLRMISMAELRDPNETGNHVKRVAGYSVAIYENLAKKKGLPKREVEKNSDFLHMAAMLHDVGKVAISDVVLKKPGRFTLEEYEIMKDHTWKGARLFLNKQSDFDEIASTVALNHHENWDGTGYPGHVNIKTGAPLKRNKNGKVKGKKGNEIPIFSRIVAVADVYDALRSKRIYKKAWHEDEVLKEMHWMSGTKFDPELIDAFFEVLPWIKTISSKYPEKKELV